VAGFETSIRSGCVQEGFCDAADFRFGIVAVKNRVCRRLNGTSLQDPFDVGNEAHVQHAVGFVDHEQFDAGEEEGPPRSVCARAPTRVAISTSTPRVSLVSWSPNETARADQKRDVEFLTDAVFVEILFDLRGKLRGFGSRIRVRACVPGPAALFPAW